MRRRMAAAAATVLAAGALLTGCGTETGSSPEAGGSPTAPAETAPEESPEGGMGVDPMRPAQEQAVDDLAPRLDVDPGAIEVVAVEDVSWPDGSLGCPEPGQMYTQAVVEGVRVLLAHDGTEYAYHSGGDREPFLCESPAAGGA